MTVLSDPSYFGAFLLVTQLILEIIRVVKGDKDQGPTGPVDRVFEEHNKTISAVEGGDDRYDFSILFCLLRWSTY